jgi:hypothetical protein
MSATKTVASGLSRKATLVSVNVSIYTARRFDRNVTDEVNKRHRATDDAGRYNKLLIEAEHLKACTALVSQARELHYKYTRAWGDDGQRILPNTLYAEFVAKFRVIKQEYEAAADAFCRNFTRYVNERKAQLNGLFNPADYPSAADIRSKFKLELRFGNVPDAGDFRSEALDESVADDIRAEIAEAAKQQEREAINDTFRQIADVVGHMSAKLKEFEAYDPNKKNKKTGKVQKVYFKDTLVENVRELAGLLPAFNLTDDPRLTNITTRIEKELLQDTAKDLRENDDARVAVQKSAEEIYDAVSAFMA